VADLDAAVELTRREQADACVLDIGIAASTRPGALQAAMADSPKTAFVVLADSPDSSGLAATLAAGVHGAALKTDDFVEVLRVLTGAATRLTRRTAGGVVLSLSAQAAHRPVRRSARYPALDHLLTPREREVLSAGVRRKHDEHGEVDGGAAVDAPDSRRFRVHQAGGAFTAGGGGLRCQGRDHRSTRQP
jgi:DNA-binding NarL/FixJ family response regulator